MKPARASGKTVGRCSVVLLAVLALGCSSGAAESAAPPTADATSSTTTTVATTEAPRGRRLPDPGLRPEVAQTPRGLARQIVRAERAVRDPDTPDDQLTAWGHTQQIAYSALAGRPRWDEKVRPHVPTDLHLALDANIAARRTSAQLLPPATTTELPAWRIVSPEPIDDLLGHYMAAEDATGIEWEYLAAINLVETRMGRIDGVSSAGAQGPMQFLPTTWAEAGIGEGDIDDPGDAIAAAARYLVRRGGPDDMAGALWGYNNSDAYVQAVQAYAQVMRDDPAAYRGYHRWQVYYATAEGTIWLQEGYDQAEPIEVLEYLADHPEAG